MIGIPLCMADRTIFFQAHLFFYQNWGLGVELGPIIPSDTETETRVDFHDVDNWGQPSSWALMMQLPSVKQSWNQGNSDSHWCNQESETRNGKQWEKTIASHTRATATNPDKLWNH